ncbi:TIGR03503 family protein [Shewanella gaetbuli]|uniref:TIGR03503 family protein n=1 Tax=Shewanella gaetbuli TaxID=220752 RepID=A0A9X1ZIY3_9GAMM|nr:TIGR03503 family protein [Shewanella gaetbuli]MCL1142568.1 TIGR03503 family protein [Shewanella gaetbuli]
MNLSVNHKLMMLLIVFWFTPLHCFATDEVSSDKTIFEKYIPAPYAMELKNRFRIDHKVDQVTLIVQRGYGSSPVVVVLPDGSKWYSSRHPSSVKWVDGITGDIISIVNPTPGPWQLLGDVLPGSKIEKVSEIDIEVEPLPQPLFQGEQLKVVAKLTADDLTMRMPGLEFMVEWTSKFTSQHLPGDDNFATGTIIVGAYKDNGEGLDEQPDDGIFTGSKNLDQPTGHYTLSVTARNNIFEREFTMPFKLSKQPVLVEMMPPAEDDIEQVWHLKINVDEGQVLLSQTHVQLELTGPAGLQIPVVLTEITSPEYLLPLPTVSEYGSYRVKGSVASTTIRGREILLNVPEMFFNLIEPPQPPPSEEEMAARAAKIAAMEEEVAKQDAIFWIITINSILFVLGIIGLIIWRKKQALAKALAAAELRIQQEEQNSGKKSSDESLDLDDIDLTLPDDKS